MDFYRAGTALLRIFPPELAHELTLALLRRRLHPPVQEVSEDPILATEVAGLRYLNPIGLAAGFDKNGDVIEAMQAFGFGAIEIGSVTPKPQAGNPKPRLFRLEEDKAVINRMGFNNLGHAYAASKLRSVATRQGIIGINLGANKDSADRMADYEAGLQQFVPLADYLTINISSPNTPGLRALQSGSALRELLSRLADVRARLLHPTPVFLKVAPDVSEQEIQKIVELSIHYRLSGLIIGNTTVSRPSGLRSPFGAESGGLSGAPLMTLSTNLLGAAYRISAGRLPLIGVGGIASGLDAYRKIRAGASLLQLYSALVFQGPSLVSRIKSDLAAKLRADGFASLGAAVGADWR